MSDFDNEGTYYEQSERYVTRLNHELKRLEDQIIGGAPKTLEDYNLFVGKIWGLRTALDLFVKRNK